MAEKEYIPKNKPKYRIDPGAIHTARRKLQSLSKDGRIDFNREEREAVLQLIADGKKKLYPNKMSVDRYEYHLNQIAKVDKNTDPKQWDFFFQKIQQFEEKYCK